MSIPVNVSFLTGDWPDCHHRYVDEYLKWGAEVWELQHDVIQNAFPTKTKSLFQPDQPFLPQDFDAATLRPDVLQRCRATISLLLHGYMDSLGVEFLINQTLVTFEFKWLPHPHWADSNDHNTLRFTRILECLGIFGMTDIQQSLYDFLVYDVALNNFSRINARTLAFWVAAKENKLSLVR